MKKTVNGCSYSDVWASPKNWKTAKKTDLTKCWYVQCNFFDPAFQEKYPRGFPFRKKVNREDSVEERQALIQLYLEELPKLLDSGYNPITKLSMNLDTIVNNENGLHENTPFITALEFVFDKRENNNTKTDMKSVFRYAILVIKHLHLDSLSISEVRRGKSTKIDHPYVIQIDH